MAARRTYTAGIVGTGRIGFSLGFDRKREQPASHTMALLAERRIQIASGCDTDAGRLSEWRRFVEKKSRRAVRACTGLEEFLAAPPQDIVVIAVNEGSHLPAALAVIGRRPRLVILEKPVALNVREGRRIADAAAAASVPVLVNHERRFAEDYRLAARHLPKIGRLQTVQARLDSGLRVYSAAEEQTGAYSPLHDGTHLVDAVLFLLEGAAASASAPDASPALQEMQLSGIFRDSPGAVRSVSAHFRHPACPDVNITISGGSRFFGFEIDIIGTEGRIRIGNGVFSFFRREQSRLYTGFWSLAPDRSVRRPAKTRYFSNMVRNAADFLDGSAPLRSTLEDGLRTLEILEAVKSGLA